MNKFLVGVHISNTQFNISLFNKICSIQIGFREIRQSYFCSQQNEKLRCNRLLQCFSMKVWAKRTSIKTEKLFGLSINSAGMFNTGSVFNLSVHLTLAHLLSI